MTHGESSFRVCLRAVGDTESDGRCGVNFDERTEPESGGS